MRDCAFSWSVVYPVLIVSTLAASARTWSVHQSWTTSLLSALLPSRCHVYSLLDVVLAVWFSLTLGGLIKAAKNCSNLYSPSLHHDLWGLDRPQTLKLRWTMPLPQQKDFGDVPPGKDRRDFQMKSSRFLFYQLGRLWATPKTDHWFNRLYNKSSRWFIENVFASVWP